MQGSGEFIAGGGTARVELNRGPHSFRNALPDANPLVGWQIHLVAVFYLERLLKFIQVDYWTVGAIVRW